MRMSEGGLPVPPAFVLTTDLCRSYEDNGRQLPARSRRVAPARRGDPRTGHQPRLRRESPTAPGVGPLRCCGLDARHARHDPEHRPQRRHRSRAPSRDRATRHSSGIRIAGSSRPTPKSSTDADPTPFGAADRGCARTRGRASGRRARRRRTATLVGVSKTCTTHSRGHPFPQDPIDQLMHADRIRAAVVVRAPGRRLPPVGEPR